MKRTYLILLFCCFCALLSAQTPLDYAVELTQSALSAMEDGAYEDAEQDLLEALQLRDDAVGRRHSLYLASLNDLANLYRRMRRYQEAEQYYLSALEIRRSLSGEHHPDYAVLLNNLSALYAEQGRFAEALRMQQQALAIQEEVQGRQSLSYVIALNNLSQLCKETGDYANAMLYAEQAVAVGREIMDENDPTYATLLNNIGLLMNLTGDYDNAIRHQQQSLETLRLTKGEAHPDYAVALNNLANIYADKGDYAEAERCYRRALDIQRQSIGEYHPEYAATLSNIGAIYDARGEYTEAEQYYRQALEIRREVLGEEHPDYANSLNNLGVLYMEKTDYAKAEQCYRQALEIRRKTLGENHPDYALSLSNLGSLAIAIGDYALAEDYFRQSMRIKQQIVGASHPDYALALNNMAMLSNERGQLQEAERYYLAAIEILRTSLGERHPAYATALCNLAVLYDKMDHPEQAEQYYLEVLSIQRESLGERHADYARTLNNLGALYGNHGDYAKAEQYYRQALAIWREVYGEEHPSYAVLLDNIAQQQLATGHAAEADSLYRQSASIYKEMYLSALDYMSEKQRASYWQMIQRKYAETYPVYVMNRYKSHPEVSSFAYDNELFIKGLLLNSSTRIRYSILESGDDQLIARWRMLNDERHQLMSLQQRNPQSSDLATHRRRAEDIEKQLIASSAAFRENRAQWYIRWQDIRQSLRPGQVAIEFFVAPIREDSVVYCALLLRADSESPLLLPLFEEHAAQRLIHTATEGLVNQTYAAEDNGQALSQLIWGKLLPHLHAGEVVFFAPTGLLHQLAIEALPYNDESTIGDLYNLVRLSSTRELLAPSQDIHHASATLYGGIQYSTASSDPIRYLPGTLREVEQIAALLTGNGLDVQIRSAMDATESSFLSLAGQRRNILHIATHGFFHPDNHPRYSDTDRRATSLSETGVVQTFTRDPLTRCGLLMAGADMQDETGVLTAKEISMVDLRETNLVVLSACETGRGELTGDEVYGLQRAFKMAGAKTIIMSLWPVNDAATQLLMTEFYRNWIERRQSKRQAFRNAQNTVRERFEEPVYWAGFIILD
ncbi:MAG: tetratricopeptide repeat protein [Paludibacteraceae bacterium]|nr:tetratricopeptide repeat protein [Paludibacteraceae bacterium]